MAHENLTLPVVNLHGTPRERLKDQYYDAARAIRQALEKLDAASPHGRDYQTIRDPLAWKRANEEHIARYHKLTEVLEEVEYIGQKISETEPNPSRSAL